MQDKQYILGRGRVHFGRMLPGTKTVEKGRQFLGNCPSFSTTSSTDTLDHFSSTGGLRIKDASVDLQVNRTGTMTCDNMDKSNIALFFSGTEGIVTQVSATSQTETRKLFKGYRYQIGATPSNPIGFRNLSNFKISTTGGTPVDVAAAGNYTVDLQRGIVTILDNAAGITDGTSYTLSYDVGASSYERVIASNESVFGELYFEADNAVGKNLDYFLPYVKLSPNGDLNLIGDEWQQAGFNFEILQLDGVTAPLYISGQPVTV